MLRSLRLRTVAEEITLEAPDELTLAEFLRAKRIPSSLFQAYLVEQGEVRPIPSNIQITSIPAASEIVLQCIRNTDLKDVLPQQSLYDKVDSPVTVLSELTLGGKECTEIVREIDSDSARQIAGAEIAGFMKTHSASDTLIAGISGGGDSNTLVEGLAQFARANGKKLIAYTIVLNPIWPHSAAGRAAELCKKYGVEHRVFTPKELETLFDMKDSMDNCYKEYCARFGNNTSHFFGTFLISLVARKLCVQLQSTEYLLGFNREDLLSDLLYSIMNGQKPLAFPVKTFGDIRLLMPLWKIPKVVLDACYPKYSLTNYQERERDESTSQRNLIYYLAHGIDDFYPNLGLSIMQGVEKLFADSWPKFRHEEEFDLYVSEYADQSKVEDVKLFLKEYFGSAKRT